MSDETKPTFKFFGRDVSKMPCFRSAVLYGFTSGIGAGILTFMFTSRAALASHTTIGTIMVVNFVYFGFCRYRYTRDVIMMARIRGLMVEAQMNPQKSTENIKAIFELKEE